MTVPTNGRVSAADPPADWGTATGRLHERRRLKRVDLDPDHNARSQSIGPPAAGTALRLEPQFIESIQAEAHRNGASCRHRC